MNADDAAFPMGARPQRSRSIRAFVMLPTLWRRRNFIKVIVCAAAIPVMALALFEHPALADFQYPVAALQCNSSNNKLLIRFGVFDGFPQAGRSLPAPDPDPTHSFLSLIGLPDSLAKSWSQIPYEEAGDCKFRNGQKLSVSGFRGSWQRGANGSDISGGFAMTVNGYPVYKGLRFYPGYGNVVWTLSAIVYDGKSLLECQPLSPAENFGRPDASDNVICRNVSSHLQRIPLRGSTLHN